MQEDKPTYKEAATEVVKEVKEVWKHHFGLRVIEGHDYDGEEVEQEVAEEKKMIKRDQHIQDIVVAHMKELTDLKYEARRKVRRKNFEAREAEFVELLRTPLNILKVESVKTESVGGEKVKVRRPGGEEVLAKSGIISWQEDMLHLHNQLTKEQPGTCQGVDKRQKQRDTRVFKTKKMEERKRVEEFEWNESIKKVCQEDDDEVEKEDDSEDEFKCEEKVKIVKVKKLNVMGHISGTADRLNLSVRKRAMMAASTTNALGIPFSTTNISVTSAWRHSHKVRKTLATEIKKTFDPDRQFVLHWDGKTMNLRRGEKSNFVAIYLTTVDGTKKHHLLDIPRVCSGKAKDELDAIQKALNDWGVKKSSTIGLVFDTTSSNTGEWSGVCRLLNKWIGTPVLWPACRRHMMGIRSS